MYIESVPNRNSPPAILLRESYREDGKVRKRTLCDLSDWPKAHVEGLPSVLKGGTVVAAAREALTVARPLPLRHRLRRWPRPAPRSAWPHGRRPALAGSVRRAPGTRAATVRPFA
jgi:hypothetical protein